MSGHRQVEAGNTAITIRETIDSRGEGTGIEAETRVPEHAPLSFSPGEIRFTSRTYTIGEVLERFNAGRMEMQPDFQRRTGQWEDYEKSRFIESILLRLPLPMFFVSATVDGSWVIVDGLQRLSTLIEFILGKTDKAETEQLSLTGMELLVDLEGATFNQLSSPSQRLLLDTPFSFHILQPQTPQRVVRLIYTRINNTRFGLTEQDIRHAAYKGAATDLLNRLAENRAFVDLVNPKSRRGIKRYGEEMILRFLAFWNIRDDITAYEQFGGVSAFLDAQMIEMNEMSKDRLVSLEEAFERAIIRNKEIFGRYAFRKRFEIDSPLLPLNKALFETWSVALSELDTDCYEKLVQPQKEQIEQKAIEMLVGSYIPAPVIENRDRHEVTFADSISSGTNSRKKIVYRFAAVRSLLVDNQRGSHA